MMILMDQKRFVVEEGRKKKTLIFIIIIITKEEEEVVSKAILLHCCTPCTLTYFLQWSAMIRKDIPARLRKFPLLLHYNFYTWSWPRLIQSTTGRVAVKKTAFFSSSLLLTTSSFFFFFNNNLWWSIDDWRCFGASWRPAQARGSNANLRWWWLS